MTEEKEEKEMFCPIHKEYNKDCSFCKQEAESRVLDD